MDRQNSVAPSGQVGSVSSRWFSMDWFVNDCFLRCVNVCGEDVMGGSRSLSLLDYPRSIKHRLGLDFLRSPNEVYMSKFGLARDLKT